MGLGSIGTGGAFGGVATLLLGAGFFSPVLEPPRVEHLIDAHGVLGEDEECHFYNGSVVFESDHCSAFELVRLSSSVLHETTRRATQCAVEAEVACVLSVEIGFAAPAAFLVSDLGDLRMVLAPRLLPHGGTPRRVRASAPQSAGGAREYEFNATVKAEYLTGASRAPVSEVFEGDEAYCVQLLRAAFAPSCWALLD